MTQTKADIPAAQARLMARETVCPNCGPTAPDAAGKDLRCNAELGLCQSTGFVLMFKELRRECHKHATLKNNGRCEEYCTRCHGLGYVWNDAPNAVATAILETGEWSSYTLSSHSRGDRASVNLMDLNGDVYSDEGLRWSDALLVALDRAAEGA